MQRVNQSSIELQTIELLKASRTPCSISYIARQLDVAWVTARALLLTLAIEGKIKWQKTMNGTIFSIDSAPASVA